MSIKHKLRMLLLYLALLAGSLSGLPMRPEDMGQLMEAMNQERIEYVIRQAQGLDAANRTRASGGRRRMFLTSPLIEQAIPELIRRARPSRDYRISGTLIKFQAFLRTFLWPRKILGSCNSRDRSRASSTVG